MNLPRQIAATDPQIEAADREIDQLVYDLYGLTNDEIRIARGGRQFVVPAFMRAGKQTGSTR